MNFASFLFLFYCFMAWVEESIYWLVPISVWLAEPTFVFLFLSVVVCYMLAEGTKGIDYLTIPGCVYSGFLFLRAAGFM